jgi:predicted ester cyclase
MTAEENKAALLRVWDEVYVHGRLDAVDHFVHDHVVAHESDGDVRGIEAFKRYAAPYLVAFSDLSVTVDDLVAEGDRVVARWTDRGTHDTWTEEFGPPTGVRVSFGGMTLYRFEGDKVAELWDCMDSLGLLRQLGRTDLPAAPPPD